MVGGRTGAAAGLAFALVLFVCVPDELRAEQEDDTPALCKKRVGTEFECFQSKINGHIVLCSLKQRLAELKPEDKEAQLAAGICGDRAKKSVRPFYESMLRSVSKKPAATAATKKAMQAFMVVVSDISTSRQAMEDLKKAFAELELEL